MCIRDRCFAARILSRRPEFLCRSAHQGSAGDRGDAQGTGCLLYTSDAADERSSVDLGGRRIIKKKNRTQSSTAHISENHIAHVASPT